jgi:hypothetical protein
MKVLYRPYIGQTCWLPPIPGDWEELLDQAIEVQDVAVIRAREQGEMIEIDDETALKIVDAKAKLKARRKWKR